MTRIAVVIPAFNPGGRLQNALASVLAQTLGDWECAVVDDGSAEDLSWVASTDDRVRLIRQSNSGTSAARNTAMAATSAPLIAFLDQDDEWLPEKLEAQAAVLDRRRDIGLCDTNFHVLKDGCKIADGYREHEGTYAGMLAGGAMGLSTVVARRAAVEAAGGFNPCFRIMQDADLYLRVLMLGWGAFRLQEVHARYNLHDANTSADYRLALAEHRVMLEQHRVRAKARGDDLALAAIRQGEHVRDEILGSQAFDAFRRTRHPSDLVRAARLRPRGTFSQLKQFVQRASGPRDR
jgi:glycosyltransferase involved in cell wall biosynthesis